MKAISWKQKAVLCLCFALFFPACRPKTDETLKKSVVKVYSTVQSVDFFEPWKPGTEANYLECGCIVFGNRVLTTAQMADKSNYIEVQKFGETKHYTAKVEKIGFDMDLALLTVDNKDFFKGTDSVDFGDLPQPGDSIKVFGGDELSIKEDTVSGLKMLWSTEALRTVPALLVGSEINPNSYGCPVFSKGKLVGIPIDTTGKQDKTGSLMPINMIQRFFKGIKNDRTYDGFPDLGIVTENLESPILRSYYKLTANQTGQVITRLVNNGSAIGYLKESDVLLAIDGHTVDNDGFVTLPKIGRIEYDYLDAFYMTGEEAAVDVLRDGQPLKVKVPMKPVAYRLPYDGNNRKPTYFMFAGFVFVPLTYNYIQMSKWVDLKPELKALCSPTADEKPIVLISHVLPHEINAGYSSLNDFVVKEVNGQPIHGMKDLIAAFDKPLGKFHKIEIDDTTYFGSTIIFDAKKAKQATQDIMTSFKIPSDRSDDLK